MSESKTHYHSGGGISFAGLLTIVFITLKLCGVIDWTWLWVLSPIWISLSAFACIALPILLVVIVVAAMTGDSLERRRWRGAKR